MKNKLYAIVILLCNTITTYFITKSKLKMKTDNRILDIVAYISFHALISLIVFMIFVIPIDKRFDNLEFYPTRPVPVFDKNLLRDGCSLNYYNNETKKTGYDLANPNKTFYLKTVLLVCNSPFIQQ